MEAQRKQIREHLQKGKSLTKLEALYYFNCFSLSSRMSNLKKEGLKFKSELITITSVGKTKRVSKYSL